MSSLPFFFSVSLLLSLQLSTASPPEPSKKAQSGGGGKVELWCVAKNNAEDAALQAALDWACGPGRTDCGPVQQGGPCYDPSDIQRTASFAFNNYYLKNGLTDDSCYFDNTAALTSLNPSHDRCKFPSSLTVNNGSFSGSLGSGPASEDLSGCERITRGLFWPLIISQLFLIISRIFTI